MCYEWEQNNILYIILIGSTSYNKRHCQIFTFLTPHYDYHRVYNI